VDLIGTIMGFATIPMALLSMASVIGGLLLLAHGAWQPTLFGLVAFAICYALAGALERVVITIDDAAALSLQASKRGRARGIAAVSGGLPIIVILGWEYACFRLISSFHGHAPFLLLWLWSYGIATGPWSLFAQRVSRFRRTLCGIRSYAGHIAYWLLSTVTMLGAPQPIGLICMFVPATLPFVVGMLLAIADRDALTNVRV